MKTETTTRAHAWTLPRRLSDWAFRYKVPGKHHSLENSLLALMLSRESAP